ncbi:4'-phosphopantetheinyl transferase superfamily protein [Streptomyces sp. NPDC089922]|uniref:4'-phosphopantetheinyl transferase family protein n=1 Tax=unclassified Streptomyces TaxID=2593676 RepID=UPI0034248357
MTGASGPERVWQRRVSGHLAQASRHASVLDAAERARLAAFRAPAERDRYLVAHVAVRTLLGECLGIAPGAVRLTREPCTDCGGPHGRPVVADATGVHFSLSHAGDLVAVAVAAVPVGVDVEELPPPAVVARTAPAALHPGELAALAALPEDERPAAFARCWTRKEAYLKATGTGLNTDPTTVLAGAGTHPVAVPGWRVADVPTLPGYAAAVAAHDPTDAPRPAHAPETAHEHHGKGPA